MPGEHHTPFDVLVCGGGLAGTMAAVAAARGGARTALIERYGFLGGNATAGAVAQLNCWQTGNGRAVIAGLAAEVVERLRGYDGAREHDVFVMSNGHRMDRVEYAPEILKLVLDDMTTAAGVELLLHASLIDVAVSDRRVTAVHVLTKSGPLALAPCVMIDSSGDLDALVRCGATFLPLEPGESLQPATAMFRFGPVDAAIFDRLTTDQLAALAERGYAEGRLARAALHAARDPNSADRWFNVGRVAVDATDARALARAEVEGRRQAWRAAEFLREAVPGCSAGRLVAFATQLGIRETRRVVGDLVLQADDLRRATLFDDSIAAGAYPIDIHLPAGAGLHYEQLGPGVAYQIPYRCLIPMALDNALVAGRGVSASHAAQAAIRVMTISMAVGQAAGTAAAIAACRHAGEVRRVDSADLRSKLTAAGAILA